MIIFALSSLILLCVLLWWRYRVGIARYFDADELAYLHWAHNVFAGRLPYVDFLSYVPSGFLYVLAPLFLIAKGTSIFPVGRIFAWVVFTGMCAVLGGIFMLMRGRRGIWGALWMFVLPGIFLSFLPMPADKLMEIRPDNLSMLVALVGMYFHIRAFSAGGTRRSWFWAGFFYTAALVILPKALPQAGIAVLVTIGWWIWGGDFRKQKMRAAGSFIAGLFIPAALFAVWVGLIVRSVNQLDTVIYSLLKLPLEVNRIGELFGMDPNLFFYPNDIFYGSSGWNIGLITNHVVWLIGLIVGVVRLCTPFIGGKPERGGVWGELLVAGSFIAYVVAFMYGYPLRHAQYLIPVAVFVAWYAADCIFFIWNVCEKRASYRLLFALGYLAGLCMLYQVAVSVYSPKLAFTDAADVQILQDALTVIGHNAYVLDMVGSTIYFRDPFYVSAVPFGQWEPYLSRPLPDLVQVLERTKTMYLYDGRSGRLHTLSSGDQAYIDANYSLMPTPEGLYKRNR